MERITLHHALCLFQDKFVSELEIVVKKRSSVSVTIDEQWASEKEMRDDLGWTP